MKNNYSLVKIDNIQEWIEMLEYSKNISSIQNVVPVDKQEYDKLKGKSNESNKSSKNLILNHIIQHKNLDGEYLMKEYFIINDESEILSVYLNSEKIDLDSINKISKSNSKSYNFSSNSPLNVNSPCAKSRLFMGCWSFLSILGLILLLSFIFSLFNGLENSRFLNSISNYRDKIFLNFDNEKRNQQQVLDSLKISKPREYPIEYLKSLDLNKSNFLDISLIWFSQNDLDLIGVSPDKKILWEKNNITSFGILDKNSNESILDTLNQYSLQESLLNSKEIGIEHMYIPENINIEKGTFSFYVLNSDKRVKCGYSENFITRVIYNGEEFIIKGTLDNTINNRCIGEKGNKQVYTFEKINFYIENNAGSSIFNLEIK
ncbi:MAG: hypothetical protein HN595_05810 [Flavobacteriaceae bacterium]|jgi:hypothetical protein|nr:hypothetical protein [Flavobacteriaceae bacterium]